MTAVAEDTKPDTKAADVDDDDDDDDDDSQEKRDGRKERERDFTKFTDKHQELADFVNANDKFKEAGLDPVTPNQIKAILALRTDFNDTPEQRAAREERKRQREEEAKEFAGMTQEQIKAEKAARRAEKQAEKMRQRVEEALKKAQAIREGRDASGADVAAAVEAQQGNGEAKTEPKKTIGRRK